MNATETNAPRLMSFNDVAAATTLSKTLVRQMADAGLFPVPLAIGVKRIAWVRAEVESWIDARISSRTGATAA